MNTNTNTTSTKNSKNAYLDFYTSVLVPAHIEYKVKFTITYSITKVTSSGTAGAYAKLYEYGDDEIIKDVYVNAENLYNYNSDDLQFDKTKTSDNSYWITDQWINVETGNKTVSKSYEFEATYSNRSKEDKNYVHNFGYYGFIEYGTTYASSMRSTITVSASITQTSLKLTAPKNIEIEYTGQELSLADVDSAQKAWYDSDLMSLTYPDEMKDAGEYQIKASISNDDDVFAGEPDLSNGESDTERVFTFKINKKKIGIQMTDKSDGDGFEVSPNVGAVYIGDTPDSGRAPIFAIAYKNISSGKVYDTYPTDVGTYTASVSIVNDCNYELDDTYEKTVTVKAKEIAKPDVGLKTLDYNGEERSFTVSGVSDDVTITPQIGSGMTYADKQLKAKDVGKYKVVVSLADSGKNTQWVGGGTADYEINLEITKATLIITFNSVGGWSWNSNIEKMVSITDNRKKDTESLSFSASYDSTPISDINAGEGKTTNIKIPKLSTKDGGYVLSISLNNTGDGKNYNLGGVTTQKFNITDKEIKVEDSNIIWFYSNDNKEIQLDSWSSESVFEVTYNGKEFTFAAKTSQLDEDDEVVIDKYTTTQSGTNAGEYTTTVTLTSSKGNLTKSSFTLKWKINKALFDLSNVKWNYDPSNPFKFIEDTFQQVKLMGLPEGVQVEYEDNSKIKVGEYSASVSEITIAESLKANYVCPQIADDTTYICKDESGNVKVLSWTLDWKIDKAVLDLSWQKKSYEDKNFRKIRAYEVADAAASEKIEYRYYSEKDFVDGEAIGDAVEFSSLVVTPGVEEKFWVVAVVKSECAGNYEIKAGTQYKKFTVGSQAPIRDINIQSEFEYDGKGHGVKDEWQVSNNIHIVAQYYS
ncbi:MAG: hypothetical protein K2L61_03340, partial [Clostridia bacterium]|nr:hypothetical protein [Clostridia bacterium]